MSGKIRLTVTTGPDRGKSEAFTTSPIRIGRDQSNDFCLSDGFVSNFHGRISSDNGNGYSYEDLDSRHGSLLAMPDEEGKPSNVKSNKIVNGAKLYIGCTEVLVTLIDAQSEENRSFNSPEHRAALQSTYAGLINNSAYDINDQTCGIYVTSSYSRDSPVFNKFTEDNKKALDLIFDLSGKLNAATSLDDVLELTIETVFKAFPSANYFSITMTDNKEQLEAEPYISRVRGKHTKGRTVDNELITSRSMMERALQKRESILFTENDPNIDPSKSMFMAQVSAAMCVPLVGQQSLLGVLQLETRGQAAAFCKADLDLLSAFASNVSFAIERAKLNGDLENLLEKFVDASVTAIEARDPTTAGHSHRVSFYTLELAKAVNLVKEGPWAKTLFSQEDMRELRYAALLHDFGKICVKESVLQKSTRLPTGGIEQVRIRFELIASLYESDSLRKILASTNTRSEPPEELLYAHSVRVSTFKNELDQELRFLEHANKATYLKEEEVERVKRIASRTYFTLAGEPRPYLTSSEVENLSVRRGTLNEREWIEMRSHAQRSEEYLRLIPWTKNLERIPTIAGAHHEKLDGSGYPRGLKADELPVQVRMLTIADIFDALTATDRPYRRATPKEGAIQVLLSEVGVGKLDTHLVDIFRFKVCPALRL